MDLSGDTTPPPQPSGAISDPFGWIKKRCRNGHSLEYVENDCAICGASWGSTIAVDNTSMPSETGKVQEKDNSNIYGFCPVCGTKARDGVMSCMSCGSPLSDLSIDTDDHTKVYLGSTGDSELHDFEDDNHPVLAHRHPNGGGWVADTASVAITAFVGPEAAVFDSAQVRDNATITDTAWVVGNAVVDGNALIAGDAEINEDAHVGGEATVDGTAFVSCESIVEGNAHVGGNARILDRARVNGTAQVLGEAVISGNVVVSGNNRILPEESSPPDAAAPPTPRPTPLPGGVGGPLTVATNYRLSPPQANRTNPAGRTEPTAIGGFILAFIFWPAGIILGHVARSKIRRSGEQGAGLALAALTISYVWGAVVIIIIILAVTGSGSSGFNNLTTLEGSVTQQINHNLHNSSNSAYSPGTSVTSTLCVHNSGTQFSCMVVLSNGSKVPISVTVSSDGSRWVSNG